MKKVNSHICKVTIICVSLVLPDCEDTFALCDMHSVGKCSSAFFSDTEL